MKLKPNEINNELIKSSFIKLKKKEKTILMPKSNGKKNKKS